jgi:hypothetical protein
VSLFQPIPIVSKKEARAPIAAKLTAFNKHRKTLLSRLRNECKKGPASGAFDANKSWNDLTQIAQLFFWGQDMEQDMLPSRDRVKRLNQLARALRHAHGLARRAMGDSVGDDLHRAWFAQKNISLISVNQIDKDGSSILTRTADEIKEAVASLTTLEAAVRAAAATIDVPSATGRPSLLPRDCIQGLARAYRSNTGSKPGRGAGPFADFASEFMVAVGQTGFSRRSLIDAIQDAHPRFKHSWFDENIREPYCRERT